MAKGKATKKFEHRHLKEVLKQRGSVSKIKKSKQRKEKKRARAQRDASPQGNDDAQPSGGDDGYKRMAVDDFFQTGFELPERVKAKRKAAPSGSSKAKKAKLHHEDSDSDDGDSSPLEDHRAGGTVDAAGSAEEDAGIDDEEDHKTQLEALKKKDPEFYKYLEENDDELLQFEDDDLAAIDLLSDEDASTSKQAKSSKDSDSKEKAVDAKIIERWRTALVESKSLRSTRELILAFRAAVHASEESQMKFRYSIPSPEVYNKVIITTLKHVPDVIAHHIASKESASGKINVSTDSKTFRIISPMIKSHVTSVLHLLSTLSDDATTRITLASILSLLPYAMTHRKLVKQLAKAVVGFWSDTSSTDATKIAAFLVLRKLVVIGDAGVKDAVLKETYQGLVKGCRNTTVHSIEGINLMKNSAAELWGLDQSVGYTNGFGFIRQLAIHLRSIITNKTKDSYKAIYNWQCVHSLDFWSRVLAQNCAASADMNSSAKSQLFHLIYPVVQVTIGIIRLIPTAEYFPLRFQLLRSLLRLSRATKTYIPVAPMLYEVLASAEMRKSPKPATVKALDFSISIRVGKAMLRTRVYQDGLGDQVVELFCEFFALWCKSVSFPELALPVIVMLKRWFKEVTDRRVGNKNNKLNSAIAVLVQKLEANSKWIEQRRQNIGFAPNNRSDVERFLVNESWEITPFGAFAVAQRTAREERSKLLRDKEHQSNRRTANGDSE